MRMRLRHFERVAKDGFIKSITFRFQVKQFGDLNVNSLVIFLYKPRAIGPFSQVYLVESLIERFVSPCSPFSLILGLEIKVVN